MNEPPAMTLNYNSIIPLQVSYYGDLQKLAEHDSLVREPDNAMLFDRLRWYALLHRHCFPHYQPLAVHCHGENNRAEDTWLYLLKTGFKSCHSLTNWYSFYSPRRASSGERCHTAGRDFGNCDIADIPLPPPDAGQCYYRG